jgi:hypothetical protein
MSPDLVSHSSCWSSFRLAMGFTPSPKLRPAKVSIFGSPSISGSPFKYGLDGSNKGSSSTRKAALEQKIFDRVKGWSTAKVDAQPLDGSTPLCSAISGRHRECALFY